jgi:1-acyl-sn-glycerol-3-phosphate acyltransferase
VTWNPIKHLISIVSSTWVILNLFLWMIPIILLAVLRLFTPGLNSIWRSAIHFCYHGAARMNSLWMLKVIRVRITMEGDIGDHPSPIVISNHQSWFDIPVIHHVVTDHGPIVKFLIKRNLVWVPVVGWLCWILGFPRLYRGGGETARRKDYETIRAFSQQASVDTGAVLVFPEGTRFTEQKCIDQKSPYEHLLNPRIGGIRILKDAADPDTPIVDLTISYVGGNNHFWDCLHGATPEVRVLIKRYRLGDIDHLPTWLNERWQEKEQLLSQC